MKKLFTLFMSLALLLCIGSALAYDSFDEQVERESRMFRMRQYTEQSLSEGNIYVADNGQWIFEILENNTLRILLCTIDAEEVTVPAEFGGIAVEIIGKNAFSGPPMNTKLKKLILPDSVKIIEDSAFENCWCLEKIAIPESVTSIGESVFSSCESLRQVTLPSSLTSIGYHTFYRCDALTQLALPDSLTTIGDRAFEESGLAELTIPEGVTAIGADAFAFCEALASLSLPASLSEIGEDVFWAVNTDLSITISPDNPCLSWVDGLLVYENQHRILFRSSDFPSGSYAIPEGITGIDDHVFSNTPGLTEVTLPEGMTTLGSAFSHCYTLEKVTLPASLEKIGAGAFWYCRALKEIMLPANLTEIGDYAFRDCTALSAYDVDENNPSFDSVDGALYDKKKKTLLSIPAGYEADILTLPASMTAFAEHALDDCDTLIGYEVDPKNAAYASSNGAIYTKKNKTLVRVPSAYRESVFTVDPGTRRIGANAFSGCGLIEEILLPDSVKDIEDYAFVDCRNLKAITLPSGLKTLGENAFSWCKALMHIEIPKSVKTLEYNTFTHCESLRWIIIPANVSEISEYAFQVDDTKALAFITPSGSYAETYADQYGFKHYASLEEYEAVWAESEAAEESETAEEGTADYYYYRPGDYAYVEGFKPIKETEIDGIIWKYAVEEDGVVLVACEGKVRKLHIPGEIDGLPVTAIADEAIDERIDELDELVIPNSVRTIGFWAFGNCHTINRVIIPEGVEFIADMAFVNADSYGFELPASLKKVGDRALGAMNLIELSPDNEYLEIIDGMLFEKATNTLVCATADFSAADYAVPEGTKAILRSAFDGCYSLERVFIPASVSEMSSDLFYMHYTLREIKVDAANPHFRDEDGVLFSMDENAIYTYPRGSERVKYEIPEGTKIISDNAFSYCEQLEEVTIPEGVTEIGHAAFSGCTALKKIAILQGVESIDWFAFSGCTALSEIVIPEGVESIGWYAFSGCTALSEIVIPESVTDIGESAFEECSSELTIIAPAGSYAKVFAREHGMNYAPPEGE